MLHQGVTPLTVFPQHFPDGLLSLFSVNVRNHSLLLAPDGWLRPGKGMRETLPRLSLPLPPPPRPPGHLASVSPSDDGASLVTASWGDAGRCLGGAWDSFVTIQTRNNEFLHSYIHSDTQMI